MIIWLVVGFIGGVYGVVDGVYVFYSMGYIRYFCFVIEVFNIDIKCCVGFVCFWIMNKESF